MAVDLHYTLLCVFAGAEKMYFTEDFSTLAS